MKIQHSVVVNEDDVKMNKDQAEVLKAMRLIEETLHLNNVEYEVAVSAFHSLLMTSLFQCERNPSEVAELFVGAVNFYAKRWEKLHNIG